MFSRLQFPGIVAALMVIGCVGAAVFQGSTVAIVLAVPAAIYVAVLLFRPGCA